MTDNEKEAKAKANAEATNEAYRLAAERTARDIISGRKEIPVVQSVAESIKEKLLTEDFKKKEDVA